MVEDSNWIRRQVINSWFEIAQEKIAEKLNISVGKVNSIIQEYTKSNDWAEKARDMFISAKKNGVEINQLISNLRYENAVKKYASNRDKIELLLRGLDHLVEENSGDPTITASLIYQIIVLALKEHKYPRQILEELQSSSQQYREIKDKIQRQKLVLQKYNVTLDEIVKFNELRFNLERFGVTELNQINTLVNNIREQQDDPQRVMETLSGFSSLSEAVQGLQIQKEEGLAILARIEVESKLGERRCTHTVHSRGGGIANKV